MIFDSEHEFDLEYDYEDDHLYDGEFEPVEDGEYELEQGYEYEQRRNEHEQVAREMTNTEAARRVAAGGDCSDDPSGGQGV